MTQRYGRLPVVEPATHLFALGQAVQLKSGVPAGGNVYRITAQLPPIGDSPQYRIRNDTEKFERVATQVNLEMIRGENVSLIEKSFALERTK
jgi:hypothetical protein